MSTIIPISEGYVQFQGYKTWYCIVGNLAKTLPGKLPVLMLHDAPDIPHDRLESLKALADTGRPVVFYDQLGCGNSDVIGHLKNWDITSRLGCIRIPSLLTSGRYDEFTPIQAAVVRNTIPDCTWVLFENSHMPHAEETEHYLEVLNDYLTQIEGLVET